LRIPLPCTTKAGWNNPAQKGEQIGAARNDRSA